MQYFITHGSRHAHAHGAPPVVDRGRVQGDCHVVASAHHIVNQVKSEMCDTFGNITDEMLKIFFVPRLARAPAARVARVHVHVPHGHAAPVEHRVRVDRRHEVRVARRQPRRRVVLGVDAASEEGLEEERAGGVEGGDAVQAEAELGQALAREAAGVGAEAVAHAVEAGGRVGLQHGDPVTSVTSSATSVTSPA